MTPDQDDLLLEITQALSVEPSPGFGARVRARIEQEAPAWTSWRWVFAGAAVTAIVCVAVVTMVPARRQDIATSPAGPGPSAARASAEMAAPTASGSVVGAVRRSAVPRSARRVVAAAYVPKYEVIVPPGQLELWRQFLVDLREGRVTLPPESSSLNEPLVIEALREPPPIEIPPIRIEPLQSPQSPIDPVAEGLSS